MPFITTERNWINYIGNTWMPSTVAAQTKDLSKYDIDSMKDDNGNINRESVEVWLALHSGDFQGIDDFEAFIKGQEFDWEHEDSEMTFNDLTYPEVVSPMLLECPLCTQQFSSYEIINLPCQVLCPNCGKEPLIEKEII